MKPEEQELVQIVAEDLAYLIQEWNQDLSDGSLRRSSTVLRRLLAEKHFAYAWRHVGFVKEPKVLAPDFEEILKLRPIELVTFAQAGGARYRGSKVQSICFGRFAPTPKEIRAMFEAQAGLKKRAYTLSQFNESTCFIMDGTRVFRRDVIQYVTNKVGGAHFDPARKPNDKQDARFLKLDLIQKDTLVAEKNPIYFELLSIGQSVANSRDTLHFLKRAKGLGLLAEEIPEQQEEDCPILET